VPVGAVAYEDLEHVTVTRGFLNDPGRYLRHLTSPEAAGENRESDAVIRTH
jgi:hypothetical protein